MLPILHSQSWGIPTGAQANGEGVGGVQVQSNGCTAPYCTTESPSQRTMSHCATIVSTVLPTSGHRIVSSPSRWLHTSSASWFAGGPCGPICKST
eukprot:3085927-Prymnesium_polylepis.1